MKTIRKTVITIVGVLVLLIGVILIVLPGPALLVIPLGLLILSTEYPGARKYIRIFQRWLSRAAAKLDQLFKRRT